MPCINRQGYVIPINSISEREINKIETELVAIPNNTGGYGDLKPFSLYTKDKKNYYVPRYWGLDNIDKNPSVHFEETSNIKCRFSSKKSLFKEQPKIISELVNCFVDMKKVKLKPYQNKFINIGTGQGKTVLAIFMACFLKKRTLIVTNTDDLKNQWIDRIEEYTEDATIGYIKGKKYLIDGCDFVIANINSLMKSTLPLEELLEDFDLVIYDEAHHYASMVFSNVMRRIVTPYSIALTATLDRPDGLVHVLEWYLGDIGYKISGQLDYDIDIRVINFDTDDKSKFRELYLPKKDKFGKKVLNYSKMITNLTLIDERNQMIFDYVKDLLETEPERHIMMVSHRLPQLLYFKELFEELGEEVGLIVGKGNKIPKEDLKSLVNKRIILGIDRLSGEALDIKSLCTVITLTPWKRILQVYGRALRRDKKDYKYKPLFIDIVDQVSVFKNLHFSRLNQFKETYLNGEHSSLRYYDCNNKTKHKITLSKEVDLKEFLKHKSKAKQITNNHKLKTDPFESDED